MKMFINQSLRFNIFLQNFYYNLISFSYLSYTLYNLQKELMVYLRLYFLQFL